MKRFVSITLIAFLCLSCLSLTSCKDVDGENTIYTISAQFDGEREISAVMSVDYFNNTETEITALMFNLYPNAFREGAFYRPVGAEREAQAYPNGINFGGIEIISCRSDGNDAAFEIGGKDENILVLYLKKGVFPAERTVVEIEFKTILAQCRLRTGYYNGTVNLGNWYPILCVHEVEGFYECLYSSVGDPFYSDVADYNVSISVPGEFTVASGGVCQKTEVGDGITTYDYTFESVRDVAFVLSKDFEVFVGKTGDIEVNFYYKDCDYASDVLQSVTDAIETFGNLFGKYPYPTLTVVSTSFLQGGMEYPQLVYVSDALEREDFITATVHEVAHQWWYAVVGNNECEFAFLDEGLAEYSTLLFYEQNPSYGKSAQDIVNEKNDEWRAFCGVFDKLSGKVNTKMLRGLGEFSGEYEYVEIAYTKSFLMLDGFRQSVGDARFFKGLKRLYEKNIFSFIGPEHLISAFCGIGCDAEGYFNSWMQGKDIG